MREPSRRWAVATVCLTAALLAGFSLENSTVPREEILSGGPPKDGIPALLEPTFVPADEAGFLRDDDRVVGFTHRGEAHAYPIRVLNWHEVVTDAVGEKEIAVTWCPLTGSAVVFDRRVGGDLLTFGVSGLLYRSNVLVYDHQSETLWSQLGQRAVAGERVGGHLTALPAELTSWKAWRVAHPETRVLSERTGHRRDYARDPYASYRSSPETLFPVESHDPRLRDKELVFGLAAGDDAVAYPLATFEASGAVTDEVGGRRVRIEREEASGAVRAVDTESGDLLPGTPVYWFAWSAFHPKTRIGEERDISPQD